jgi:hypothetical protein
MSNNNFEQQVQQKMEDLMFNPSASVWNNIEAELRRNKRHRVGGWWIPLLLLLLGGAGYWMASKKNESGELSQATLPGINKAEDKSLSELEKLNPPISNEIAEPSGIKQPSSINKKHTTAVTMLPVDDEDAGIKRSNNFVQNSTTAIAPQFSFKSRGNSGKSKRVRSPFSRDEMSDKNKFSPVRRSVQTDTEETETIATEKWLPGNGMNNNTDDASTTAATTSKASITTTTIIDSNKTKKPIIAKELTKTPATKKMKKGWSWSVNASGGVSFLESRSIRFDENGLSNLIFSDQNNSQVTSFSASIERRSPFQQRVVTVGNTAPTPFIAFKVGVEAEKKITNYGFIKVGLLYEQFNSRIKTGERIEGVQRFNYNGTGNLQRVSDFYLLGNNNQFTNQYHFLQVPFWLGTQLRPSEKLPLYVMGGVSMQYLIASKVLTFDSRNQIFYKGKGLFKKAHFSVNASMTARLFNEGKHPLVVGPEAQLNLTHLLQNSTVDPSRFFYLGFRASLPIQKNNK